MLSSSTAIHDPPMLVPRQRFCAWCAAPAAALAVALNRAIGCALAVLLAAAPAPACLFVGFLLVLGKAAAAAVALSSAACRMRGRLPAKSLASKMAVTWARVAALASLRQQLESLRAEVHMLRAGQVVAGEADAARTELAAMCEEVTALRKVQAEHERLRGTTRGLLVEPCDA